MQEIYSKSGGKKTISRQSIQEMKRNMQKIPVIQQKSATYHKQESSMVEGLLEGLIQQQFKPAKETTLYDLPDKKIPRYTKIRKKISFTLFHK